MAKKTAQPPTLVELLEARVKKLEQLIVERNGTIPSDFEKLIRYKTIINLYKAEAKL